jgi:uncharacterized protein (TIGR02145 family)
MKENLRVDKFRNGDPVPKASNQDEWDKANFEQKPAWCYINDDPSTEKENGKLYNWYAINDPRGLAPEGYEIPTAQQWIVMEQELSKSTQPYTSNNEYRCSEELRDKSGFAATITGVRMPALFKGEKGYFLVGKAGSYWSSTKGNGGLAQNILFTNYNNLVSNTSSSLGTGMAVRCIKEKNISEKENKSKELKENKSDNTSQSKDGSYTFEANQIKCEIVISGERYFGTNQMGNTLESLSGSISGENIMDSYGMNVVGHIGNGYITYGPYTLNKNN